MNETVYARTIEFGPFEKPCNYSLSEQEKAHYTLFLDMVTIGVSDWVKDIEKGNVKYVVHWEIDEQHETFEYSIVYLENKSC